MIFFDPSEGPLILLMQKPTGPPLLPSPCKIPMIYF